MKVLLACWPAVSELAIRSLGPDFEVSVAHTLERAQALLKQQEFCLVVVTLRFNESSPLDLLPAAHAAGVPFAVVRFGLSRLSPEMVARSFRAAQACGCALTMDLGAEVSVLGEEAALAAFRRMLKRTAMQHR